MVVIFLVQHVVRQLDAAKKYPLDQLIFDKRLGRHSYLVLDIYVPIPFQQKHIRGSTSDENSSKHKLLFLDQQQKEIVIENVPGEGEKGKRQSEK